MEVTLSLCARFSLGGLFVRVTIGLKFVTGEVKLSPISSSSLHIAVLHISDSHVSSGSLVGLEDEISLKFEATPVWDNQARPDPPDRSMSTSSTKSAHVKPQSRIN